MEVLARSTYRLKLYQITVSSIDYFETIYFSKILADLCIGCLSSFSVVPSDY